MAEDKKTIEVTDAGAVEINETELDKASGGASDYLLQLDGVKAAPTPSSRGARTYGYDLKENKKV